MMELSAIARLSATGKESRGVLCTNARLFHGPEGPCSLRATFSVASKAVHLAETKLSHYRFLSMFDAAQRLGYKLSYLSDRNSSHGGRKPTWSLLRPWRPMFSTMAI